MRRAAPWATALAVLLGLAACAPSRGEGYLRAFAAGERAESAGRYDEAAERYEDASRAARIPRDRDYARHAAAGMHRRAGDRATAWRELRELAAGSSEEAALAADEAATMLIEPRPDKSRAPKDCPAYAWGRPPPAQPDGP